MARKNGKKRLSRKARQQYRGAQEFLQLQNTVGKKKCKENARITWCIDENNLRKKPKLAEKISTFVNACDELPKESAVRFQKLAEGVWGKRPGLLDPPYLTGLDLLTRVHHASSLENWTPAGRGLPVAFRGLATKVLGGYHANANLIDSLLIPHGHHKDAEGLVRIVQAVINGQKISKLVGTDILPVPLTKRMCHLMINPGDPMMLSHLVRMAQVVAYGGNEAMVKAVCGSHLGSFKSVKAEIFWAEVIHWFCRQVDLRPDQVGPICDYLDHCHQADGSYKMKGRTVASVNRGMNRWHKELSNLKRFASKADFNSSDFSTGMWKKTKIIEGRRTPFEIWTLREILNPRQLVEEGSSMNHCVAIYHEAIRSGNCSIWTLTMNNSRRLTIEVNNQRKAIVQVRGKSNRLPREREKVFIESWAQKNNCTITAVGM